MPNPDFSVNFSHPEIIPDRNIGDRRDAVYTRLFRFSGIQPSIVGSIPMNRDCQTIPQSGAELPGYTDLNPPLSPPYGVD